MYQEAQYINPLSQVNGSLSSLYQAKAQQGVSYPGMQDAKVSQVDGQITDLTNSAAIIESKVDSLEKRLSTVLRPGGLQAAGAGAGIAAPQPVLVLKAETLFSINSILLSSLDRLNSILDRLEV